MRLNDYIFGIKIKYLNLPLKTQLSYPCGMKYNLKQFFIQVYKSMIISYEVKVHEREFGS